MTGLLTSILFKPSMLRQDIETISTSIDSRESSPLRRAKACPATVTEGLLPVFLPVTKFYLLRKRERESERVHASPSRALDPSRVLLAAPVYRYRREDVDVSTWLCMPIVGIPVPRSMSLDSGKREREGKRGKNLFMSLGVYRCFSTTRGKCCLPYFSISLSLSYRFFCSSSSFSETERGGWFPGLAFPSAS